MAAEYMGERSREDITQDKMTQNVTIQDENDTGGWDMGKITQKCMYKMKGNRTRERTLDGRK